MYRICMYKLYDTFYEVQMLSFDGLDPSGSTFSIIVDVCSPSQQQASVKKKQNGVMFGQLQAAVERCTKCLHKIINMSRWSLNAVSAKYVVYATVIPLHKVKRVFFKDVFHYCKILENYLPLNFQNVETFV